MFYLEAEEKRDMLGFLGTIFVFLLVLEYLNFTTLRILPFVTYILAVCSAFTFWFVLSIFSAQFFTDVCGAVSDKLKNFLRYLVNSLLFLCYFVLSFSFAMCLVYVQWYMLSNILFLK